MHYFVCGLKLRTLIDCVLICEINMDSEDCEVRIMSDVDFVKMWVATMKLNHNTAEELLRHGFDTMEAISMIDKDDLPMFEILLGQQKVLKP